MEQELLPIPQKNSLLEDTTPVLIGLSLRLPQIETEEALWQFLIAGQRSRYSVDPSRKWRTEGETTYANLFADWSFFDPDLFNLTAKDIAHLDPQQKLALYGVHTCLENAGMARYELQQATTGVYAGVMTVDNLHSYAMSACNSDSRLFLNNCESSVANRVSYCFNFTGESKSINAACASSLVALKDACDSIRQGQNDFAFVLGVNYIDSALRHQSFKKAGMLSRSGWCHTFSMQADGYLPLEGMVTLLVTSKAKADSLNLPVLAAVTGISCNHNGTTSTMTAPSATAQSNLIRLAQKQCAYLDVAYIEAHGTGTNLGDPIELEALSHNYPSCYIGSIKANVGHMEAGAGLLGVAKCLLILKNRQIPPHVLSDTANVLLPETLNINTESIDYNHSQIAVSSFGFGGTNAHAILQRVPARVPIKTNESFKLPVLLSARTREDLESLVALSEDHVLPEQKYHLALNSIYTQEHLVPFRQAGWLNEHERHIDWMSVNNGFLVLPGDCAPTSFVQLRPYLQSTFSERLPEYWIHLIHDFLSDIRCIEAYGSAVSLAIKANQKMQTHLILNGEHYSALIDLDDYVSKLVHDLVIEPSEVNQLIVESMALYQHQYTFKGFLQTLLPAELLVLFEQNDLQQIQNTSMHEDKQFIHYQLIVILLWARLCVINKWQLSTVKKELLGRFSPSFVEIMALLEQQLLLPEEIKLLLSLDSAYIELFKNRLSERISTISEVNGFTLLNAYYKPHLTFAPDSQNSSTNHCIFHFKAGQSICIDLDHVSGKDVLTLSDEFVLQLWLKGFALDFERYLGAMPFERKSYFKKAKRNSLEKEKRFDTLQTTLKCMNHHEFSNLKTIHWTECSVHDILAQDLSVTIDYPEKDPIQWVIEIIRQISVKCRNQLKNQRIIHLKLDENYSAQEVELITHFVNAVNLEINPLHINVVDFKGRFYQYNHVTLQFPKVDHKGFEYRGTYVLVGGAGGIGLNLGAYLQEKYEAYIYVVGRKPYNQLSEQVQGQLQQSKMIYYCCDPDEHNALLTCLEQIAAAEKISGIFHLAVACHDEWWVKQSEHSLSTTLKQVSQRNSWLVAEELSRFAKNLYVFTSIQAYYPNLGATIYSFEAALKNYLLAQQKSIPCFITALGVIEGIGLATSADYSRYMASNDLAPLSFTELMELFELQIDTQTPFALITGRTKQNEFITTATVNKNKILEEFVALSLLLRINQSFPMHGLNVAMFFAPFQKHFQLLVRELFNIWQKLQFIRVEEDFIYIDQEVKQLEALKSSYEDELKEENYSSRLKLFLAVCDQYPELLSGTLLPHQIIFPQGNTELVQGFYEHHAVADHANQMLASKLRNYCLSSAKKIKILEVGAGSGASTRAILDALHDQSFTYYFTDISSALVNKARCYFSKYEHSMEFRVFDMEQMDSQHEFYQAFDVVIATNAIHATSDILNSLNSLCECLVDSGHLLLNELVEKTNYTTAIFGLFDGWWNAKDQHLRQMNSPLLSAEQWISVLQEMNLTDIEYQCSCLNFSFAEQIVIDAKINRQVQIKKQPALMMPLSKISMEPWDKERDVGCGREKQQAPIHSTKNQQWIVEQLAQTLYLDSKTIQLDDRLSDLGFDSLSLSDLYQKLKPKYPEFGIAELFAVDTVDALVKRFTDNECTETPDEVHFDLNHYNRETDIAIVGLSYQLPHTGSDDFISMLQQGKTAFAPIPKSRWAHDSFFDAQKGKQGKSYAGSGSFLNDIDCFDEAFFKLSPREAAFIDPQERLLLQNAYSALADANAFPIASDNKISVFVGISGAYYSWLKEDWTTQKHANSSCAYWSAANRISYSFNLHGPSMAVDTACSSSLSALHLACQSVLADESTMAVVGGVNLIVHPRQMVELSDLHMLSAQNINASFSQNADGFVYAEGVVALCIKKLGVAVAEGNKIYGVIKGSALNSGGKMHGYTVPNPEAQKQVILSALQKAGINSWQINYIEAHGTGTVLGDPIEIKALSEVYQNKAFLGSVKSNIGHSEACAGLAGLVRILLQYQDEQVFAGVNAWPLNEHCHFEKTQLIIPEKNTAWGQSRGARYSALSSFGAGGSNAHIILQDYPLIPEARMQHYSFKKQVHWIVPRSSFAATQEHPLVLQTKAYYFEQHRLHQRPILPGVAHIYFCYQAYIRNRGQTSPISIREIKWLNPIYADCEGDALALMIRFKSEATYILCELAGGLLHSSSTYHAVDDTPAFKEYASFAVECVHDVSPAAMYAQFRRNNWYHGEVFQCVHSIRVNPDKNKAIAALTLVAPHEAPTLDPRLFDSVLQCVSVLQEGLPEDQVYIPQKIEVLNLVHEWTTKIYIVVEDKSLRAFSPRYDISIFDEQYRLVSHIAGFCMIPIHKQQIIQQNTESSEISSAGSTAESRNRSALLESEVKSSEVNTSQKPVHYFKPFWQRIDCDKVTGRTLEWLQATETPGTSSVCSMICVNQLQNTQQFMSLLQNVQHALQTRKKLQLILCFDDSGETPVYAQAVHAYLRTAQCEFPELRYSVVLLPWELSSQLLPRVAQSQLPAWVKVNREGFFHTQYYHGVTPDQREARLLFKQNGVYVIAGGLGAIPKIIAQYLVTQYQARVLLLGRRNPSIEHIHWLQQSNISYKQVDVSDYEALQTCITHFVLEHGGVLNGCIQAAGVQQDSLIINQSAAAFETALTAKVTGTLNLDKATRAYRLDYFLLLSSYSSILANIGQSIYAAANGFLDGFAVLRESLRIQGECSGFTYSINLPLWEQGGMQVSDSVLVRMQKEWGMQAINNAIGCRILETLSALSWPQIIAHQGEQEVILQQLNHSKSTKKYRSELNMEFKLFVVNTIKKILELEGHFSLTASFGDLGFNSILFTELANHLNDAYDLAITPATFFGYKTIAEFIGNYEPQTKPNSGTEVQSQEVKPLTQHHSIDEDIPVIIGYSALLPGCKNLNDFWQLLVNQRHVFSQTPANRLHYMQQYPGTFIDGVDAFDAAFFNISPFEAIVMDPQQRLLLQEVWHALEMGGINPLHLKGSATGVYVGASTFDYAKLLTRYQVSNPYIPVATVHSLLANRISHYFDLSGPSEAVDTACSSSLYALDRAVKAIRQGEIEQAIVCGVNLLLDDEFFNAFTQSGMLSATKICKPFDKHADGYIRGEGIIVIILQNQARAWAQNNTIYAKILSSGVNHTGKANTLTSPSSKAQQKLYEHVYSSIDIARISYIEAHGTGTPLGDPIELEGLKNFVADKNVAIQVGSVKGNIGHLEPASGLAGLIKILLMFQHQVIPGQANLSEINPYLGLQQSGLSISQETHAWQQKQINGELISRCAAVSSFGFGGVNAHVVLEQGTIIQQHPSGSFVALIPLSAANEASLRILVKNYIDWLQATTHLDPQSFCFTLQKRRLHHRYRVMFQWHNQQQLIQQMQNWLDSSAMPQISDDYQSMVQAYLAGDAVFSPAANPSEMMPVHDTPAYPFLRKKIWFKTEENQLVYVKKEVHAEMTHQPLHNQNIVIIHAECFIETLKPISSQLEKNNKVLSYNLSYFNPGEFQLFLAAHPNLDHFIIYPHYPDFNLEINFFNQDLLSLIQPLFDVLKTTLSSNLFTKKITIDWYSYAAKANHPQVAMICGLLGSLAKEMPHWHLKHFIIDTPLARSMLEMVYPGPHQTIHYRKEQYWLSSQELAPDCEENDFLITQGTYLILGGMGGIGRRLAQFLIDSYHAKVILVGRSPLTEEGRQFVHTYGEQVEFIQTDLTRDAECALLIKYLHVKHPIIHAVFNLVMQLQDSTVDSMTWQQFSHVIQAKLFSAYFIYQLHQQTQINAAVIFSSMQSSACLAGQANYAAASNALDAYCLRLEQETALPIKIINWSIWQEVGAVADSFYLERARDLGFIPLTTQQALEAMQLGLNSQYAQFAIQNKSVPQSSKTQSVLPIKAGLDGVNQFIYCLVSDLRNKHVLRNNVVPKYTRLVTYLNGLPEVSASAESLHHLHERCCQQHPAYEAYYRLAYLCYLHYELILGGSKAPAEIVFSEEGLKLLRALYAQSPESKMCNQHIAQYTDEYLKNSRQRVKILELGAGVGATTETLMDVLNDYEQLDYYYTDVSSFFLNQGKKLQEQVRFNLHCEHLDMNHLAELADDSFDVVLASNVVHLADDLEHTLKELQRILKPQGIFLLNEAVQEQAYLNFIFGLFDGWWQASSAERLNASPLLSQDLWLQKLTAAGFVVSEQHLREQEKAQKVFCCDMNHLGKEVQDSPSSALWVPSPHGGDGMIRRQVADFIRAALHLPKEQVLELNRPLAEIGLDSITGVSLVTNINKAFNLSLRTAVIFDYPTLQRLVDFVHSQLKEKEPIVTQSLPVDLFAGELIND
ncbi:SDR family NAD(P)-dependent oxidoreductase [Fluoribacter gormanii]|uniref:SDR family NAD(P)-dependent oxidoreductase n=1 Tax=Fluoribacter gormanii TaxID=464 RepID=UPI002244C7E4|nr:SDR family NAD(P)-dependent oxidoreductase [Fluoribacter gormanii]MCW8444761.1 SDR family NAD(P)-dependent oxidoreductase [Fluoribacter gormanii]